MKKIFNTPRKKGAVLVGATILIIVVIGIIAQFINTKVAFKHFEPTYLPSGLLIKDKRIARSYGNIQNNQNFRTEDWVYAIDEYASDSRTGSGSFDWSGYYRRIWRFVWLL